MSMTFLKKLRKHQNKWCLLFLSRSLCTCPDVFHKDEKHLLGRVHVHDDFIAVQALDNCWINLREDLIEAYEICADQDVLNKELHKNIQRSKMRLIKSPEPAQTKDGDCG